MADYSQNGLDMTWYPIGTGIAPERIPGAMEVVLNIMTDNWQNSGVLSKIARVRIVEFGDRLIRVYTKFEGRMGEAPQFGPMNRVMEDRSTEMFDFTPRGAGIFFSKEALQREPTRFIGYARHILACVEELKTQMLLSIALRVENTRLDLLTTTPAHYLKTVHSTMGMNLRTPEEADTLLSRLAGVLGTEFFSAAYTSGAHIRFFGHSNGPYVSQENAGRNYLLKTNLHHRETIPEHNVFPRFGTTIGRRAMMLFDHKIQSMVRIDLEKKMEAAIGAALDIRTNFLKGKSTWSNVEGFAGNLQVQRNYGTAKMVAANLADSMDFETFLSNVRLFFEEAKTSGSVLNYIETVVLGQNSLKLTDMTMQAAIRGRNLFRKAVAAFMAQSPNNSSIFNDKEGKSISRTDEKAVQNNILVRIADEIMVTSLHDFAVWVGKADAVMDYNALIQNRVDLPIDFVCVRTKLTYDYEYVLVTAENAAPEPPITLGVVKPIVAVGGDPSNMTNIMNYKTGTGGMASPDAHKYMAMLVGAVARSYGKTGGDTGKDLTIVPIPAGSAVPDILPLTSDAQNWLAQGAGNEHVYDFVSPGFSPSAKHLLQLYLSSHSVRSAALHCIGDRFEMHSNPDAPYTYIKPVIDYAIANRN
jgi:hypothetical protein